MSHITVGQENSTPIELYYEDHGSGKPVVLIHGWPLSGASWEKQVPVLLDSGHRVITYDRRGFGMSSKPSEGYDYDIFAEDLDRIMTKLNLRDATLVGFSMGTGEVARYLSAFGSKRVSGAVFIASIPPFLLQTDDNPDGVPQSMFDGFIQSIKKDRFTFASEFLRNFYNFDVLEGQRISKEAMWASWNLASRSSAIAFEKCVNTWTTDFRADLPSIDVPTLIIHGDADRILPISATGGPRLQQAIPESTLVVMKDAPHGLIWTHADELNSELVSFLTHQARAMAA